MIGNYSTHALDIFDKGLAKAPSAELQVFRDSLANAAKFHLPHNGILVDKPIVEDDVRNMRLPYPSCALEFTHDTTKGPRKVILLLEEQPNKSLRLVLVAESEAASGKTWLLVGHFVEIRKDAEFVPMSDGHNGYLAEFYSIGNQNNHPPNEPTKAMFCKLNAIAFSFIAVINCKNVETERILPPAKLQQKRQKNGNAPLFEYHVLAIKGRRTAPPAQPLGGTHASPRLHWRRGHIRRYSNGAQTFVTACLVGDPQLGKVEKDYAL